MNVNKHGSVTFKNGVKNRWVTCEYNLNLFDKIVIHIFNIT